ncbi:MAG: hypothetical protein ABI335_14700 [Polyangiaceae bacterium]
MRTDDGNALFSKLRDELKRAAQRFDVSSHRRYEAILEICARLKSRDVCLINLRLVGDVGLSFA